LAALPGGGPMKILVAYDGSPSADAAVDEVLRRPWPPETEVRLVTVVERPFAVPPTTGVEVFAPMVERIRASVREEAFHRIQGVLARFDDRPDLQAGYELREGSTKHALLDVIREWEPDLVMAGSHGKSAVQRLLLGSVSLSLVAHAPCSVEIVKTREPHAGQPDSKNGVEP